MKLNITLLIEYSNIFRIILLCLLSAILIFVIILLIREIAIKKQFVIELDHYTALPVVPVASPLNILDYLGEDKRATDIKCLWCDFECGRVKVIEDKEDPNNNKIIVKVYKESYNYAERFQRPKVKIYGNFYNPQCEKVKLKVYKK